MRDVDGASNRSSGVALLRGIEGPENALGRLRTPDLHQVGLYPIRVELFRPDQYQRMALVVRREEEHLGLGLDEDVALLKGNFEHRRILVRAPPDPELAMRLQRRLTVGRRLLDPGQAEAQRQCLQSVPIGLTFALHGPS